MDFSDKLKLYRRMLNVTQEDIADALGVDRSTYSYYEAGKSVPTSDGIHMIANILGVPANILFEGVAPPSPAMQRLSPALKLSDHDIDLSGFYPQVGRDGNSDHSGVPPRSSDLAPDEKELIALYRAKKIISENSTDPYMQKRLVMDFLYNKSKK